MANLAYPKTPYGVIEIKRLPEAHVIKAQQAGGSYFDGRGSNMIFGRLFGYIQTHQIPMTTPVEVAVNENTMLFYAPKGKAREDLPPSESVVIATLPERTVLSVGLRGAYNQANFDKGKKTLETWLSQHTDWAEMGEPYAVYWNSPFVPGFLKHSEVHTVIEKNKD